MSLSIDELEQIKNLIVDPLSEQIKSIHTPESCPAILAVRGDIKEIHEKVDDLKGQQKYAFGIFTAILFISTFFKEAIISIFKR